jgi:hypothetical protein
MREPKARIRRGRFRDSRLGGRGLRLLLLLVPFGDVEEFQAQLVRRPRGDAERHLEGCPPDVVFGGNIAAKLKPDVVVVAVDVNGVRLIDRKLNCSHSFGSGHILALLNLCGWPRCVLRAYGWLAAATLDRVTTRFLWASAR